MDLDIGLASEGQACRSLGQHLLPERGIAVFGLRGEWFIQLPLRIDFLQDRVEVLLFRVLLLYNTYLVMFIMAIVPGLLNMIQQELTWVIALQLRF